MKKINALNIGCILLKLFLILLVLACIFWFPGIMGKYPYKAGITTETAYWLIKLLEIVILETVVFWVGIILVYINSVQLGIKWKVLGIILGWVPIANLIMLGKIISLCSKEVTFERDKIRLNQSRADEQICATKYPILMVHGVFFRDFEHLNYWGRIPGELTANGATIFYGNHNSAASVSNSAIELENRIQEIVAETGCEKVNVIAHSKGGLDICTCVSNSDIASKVASITTINTPHRGCEFADYLLHKIPKAQQDFIAKSYNMAAAKLGDIDPDFLAAVNDLTSTNCAQLQENIRQIPGDILSVIWFKTKLCVIR